MKNNLYENHFSFNIVIIINTEIYTIHRLTIVSKSNNQCIFYFLLIKKFYQPLPFSKVRSEQISYISVSLALISNGIRLDK